MKSLSSTRIALISSIRKHPLLASLIGIAIISVGGYSMFHQKASAAIVLEDVKVTRKTIVDSVSGSGTISPTNTVDLKAKGSGDIRSISVKAGDVVRQGRTLISLDATDAYQKVQTAKVNLEAAQLDLEKLQRPADSLDVLKIKDQIEAAKQAIADQDVAVATAHRTLLNTGLQAVPDTQVTSAEAPTITGSYLGEQEGSIKLTVYQGGDGLRFMATGLATGDGLASLTTPQPIGTSGLYVTFGTLNAQPNWIINLPNKGASGYLSAYNAYQNALATRDKTDAAEQRTIAELQLQLDKLLAGADSLDIRGQQLVISQRQNDLAEAQSEFSNYIVTAPFDGTIASISAEVGDSVGPSISLGKIITNKKIAEITLNEVDITKVAVGQKVELTFDAINGLRVEGTVAEVDTLGTTSQGVVTYTIKVVFDEKDERIKPGMTVDAIIELSKKDNVIVVPNEAIKTSKGKKMVTVRTAAGADTTQQVEVATGLSNDTETEIMDGINEQSLVVVQRRTQPTTTQTPSLIGGGTRTRTGTGAANRGF